MEKKYLTEFATLFKYLSDAADIIEENYNPIDVPSEHRDGYEKLKRLQSKKIEETYNRIIEIRSNTNSGFMADLTNEIETNLHKYPESREIYIKSIIRQFIDIIPYFDIPDIPKLWDLSFDWENGNIRVGNKTYGRWINYIFKIQIEYSKSERETFTIEEQYIISSDDLLSVFYVFFDAKCLDFNIDIMKLQEDLNIYLFRHRNTHHKTWFYDLGYREKLNQISIKSTEGDIIEALVYERTQEEPSNESKILLAEERLQEKEYIKFDVINQKDTFSQKYTDEDLSRIFDMLIRNKLIETKTNQDQFTFAFGKVSIGDYSPINWIGNLNDLSAFINCFYPDEHALWKKTINCFRWNAKNINRGSIKNPSGTPSCIKIFRSTKKNCKTTNK